MKSRSYRRQTVVPRSGERSYDKRSSDAPSVWRVRFAGQACHSTNLAPFAGYPVPWPGFPLDSLGQFEHISRLEKHCGENHENSYRRYYPSY